MYGRKASTGLPEHKVRTTTTTTTTPTTTPAAAAAAAAGCCCCCCCCHYYCHCHCDCHYDYDYYDYDYDYHYHYDVLLQARACPPRLERCRASLASNLIAMASLVAMASNLEAMASNSTKPPSALVRSKIHGDPWCVYIIVHVLQYSQVMLRLQHPLE